MILKFESAVIRSADVISAHIEPDDPDPIIQEGSPQTGIMPSTKYKLLIDFRARSWIAVLFESEKEVLEGLEKIRQAMVSDSQG